MRDDDPQGDYGRQKRQKQIIAAIIKKAMSASSFTKYNKTLQNLDGSLKTNLSYDDIMLIESYYKDAGQHVKSYVLQGDSEMLSGLSYQVIPASEKKKVSNRIRKQLDLDDSTYNFEKDSPFASSTESDSNYSDTTGNEAGTTTDPGYQTPAQTQGTVGTADTGVTAGTY